jgi:hypothetical protein
VLVVFLARITQHQPEAMASERSDAPKQVGIRPSDEVMELVSAIQEHRKIADQPTSQRLWKMRSAATTTDWPGRVSSPIADDATTPRTI